MISVSSFDMPLLSKTLLQIGYCSLALKSEMSLVPPATPRTIPVVSRLNSLSAPYPASSIASLATISPNNWDESVTSRILGGRPNSRGLNSISGIKPPLLQ